MREISFGEIFADLSTMEQMVVSLLTMVNCLGYFS